MCGFLVVFGFFAYGFVGVVRYQAAVWDGHVGPIPGTLVFKNFSLTTYDACQENENGGEQCCSQENFILNYSYSYNYNDTEYISSLCALSSVLECSGTNPIFGSWHLASQNCSVPSWSTMCCPIVTISTNDYTVMPLGQNTTLWMNLDDPSVIFQSDPRVNPLSRTLPLVIMILAATILCCMCFVATRKPDPTHYIELN